MISTLCIFLWFNYCTTIAHNTKDTNTGKRSCGEPSRYVDEYSHFVKRRSSPRDPDAVFFTPYIKANNIEGAITNSVVEDPFSHYESFSGFLTVDEKTNANVFMWYFPCSREDPANASLLVWLESGREYPSSSRVFETAGPYSRIGGRIRPNENTLLDNFNVLYIDTPIGSGFSFADDPDGYPETFEDAGKEVTEAVKQFALIFKQAVQNGVYLNGGDTYTSKIAVYSAWQFHHQNAAEKIRIEGVVLGNGLFDPINMIGASDLLYQLGVADEFTRQYLRSMEEDIKTLLRSGQQWEAYEKYKNMVSEIHQLGYHQMSDFTTTASVDANNREVAYFFSRRRIQEALHVGQIRYQDIGRSLCYLQQDMFTSETEIISKMIPHTRFLFHVGQYGIKVNAAKTYDFVRSLTYPGALGFHQLKFDKLCLADQIVGYQKSYENLTYFMMRNVGNVNHMMDPRLIISLWKRFALPEEEYIELEDLLMIC